MKRGGSGLVGGLVLAACALSVTGCGSKLLPQAKINATAFQTYDQVEAAYTAVEPGKTTVAELSKLGFDVKTTPNIEILSSVGVLERLPQASRSAGSLPAQVQACIDAQDHCVAYLFRSEHLESRHVGNTFLDLTGFERDTVHSGWTAEVVLLIEDGRVVYKLMSGQPRIENTSTSVQPLGPLQNVGDTAAGKSGHSDSDN